MAIRTSQYASVGHQRRWINRKYIYSEAGSWCMGTLSKFYWDTNSHTIVPLNLPLRVRGRQVCRSLNGKYSHALVCSMESRGHGTPEQYCRDHINSLVSIPGGYAIDPSLPKDQILIRTLLSMTQKEYRTTGDRNKKHKPLIEINPKDRNKN